MMGALFGKKEPKKTPQEQAREWKHALNGEQRALDRQIRKIQQAEQKAKAEAKKAAKSGDISVVRVYSKELLHSRKTIKRMQIAKTQINSVIMQIQLQMSQIKVAGGLQRSTEVMATMSQLVRVSDIASTMQNLSREMTKAGLMDEMINDTLDSVMDDVSDTEADEEVNKVVEEMMQSQMAGARVGTSKLPEQQQQAAETTVEDEEEDEELMRKFNAMKEA